MNDDTSGTLPLRGSAPNDLAANEYGFTQFRQELQLKEFRIVRVSASSLWIEALGGEGGQFPADKFEAAVAAFYKENF